MTLPPNKNLDSKKKKKKKKKELFQKALNVPR